MAFTDNCSIFASFHEEGFNRIIRHVMAQRPSLFNYATLELAAGLAKNPKALCAAIEPHPIVGLRQNPLVTIVDPLPVPTTNYGINFAVQLVKLEIDFHPGSGSLPPELAPLPTQRFAIRLGVCGGIGCPPKDFVDRLIPPPPERPGGKPPREEDKGPLAPLPVGALLCFCVDAFVTGGIRIATYNGKPYLEPFLDKIELVDIKPEGLENSIECYISLILKLVVLPGLRIVLTAAPLNLTQGVPDLFIPTNVALSATPAPARVPNNPAIEEHLLKVFIDAEVV